MLFNYLLDHLPLVLAFATPTMPSVGLPQSPNVSADAEKQRQAAADRAQRDATLGGRASTIVGGNDVAYKKRQAGADLMGAGSSRDMGL